MRYKFPPDYEEHPAHQEAVEFFSNFVGYSLSDFIPAQRDTFRLWQLAFNRVLKPKMSFPAQNAGAVADAELLLYFFAHFKEPFASLDNVFFLHPPTVFEKLEWALKNVSSERVLGNLTPFSRERRSDSVLTGMKRWSLSGELDVSADRIRQETIKLVLAID